MAEKLSGRELSEAVATKVFGEAKPPLSEICAFDVTHAEPSARGNWQHIHVYDHGDVCEWEVFPYAEDIEAAMQVEDRIAELGYQSEYYRALVDVVFTSIKDRLAQQFDIVHASAEQRCLAALSCIDGVNK